MSEELGDELFCDDCAASYRFTRADATPIFFLSDGTPSELSGSLIFLGAHLRHRLSLRRASDTATHSHRPAYESFDARRGSA
jgi:hypothetical protein